MHRRYCTRPTLARPRWRRALQRLPQDATANTCGSRHLTASCARCHAVPNPISPGSLPKAPCPMFAPGPRPASCNPHEIGKHTARARLRDVYSAAATSLKRSDLPSRYFSKRATSFLLP
jgi:hypothetical protein